jgi:glycosyltransferase involved in cell wall biosynthesis
VRPLVSILIPAFNAQRWIADTIESALGQTWERKEILIVDDGSTDQTLEVARRFASKMLTVVTQPNQGAAAARNKAFSLSQGDYIQWLDADDLLDPTKVARQLEASDGCFSKRTLLSSAWGHFIRRPYRADFNPTLLWSDLSPREWLVRALGQGLFMQPATWLVSRELASTAGPWDIRLSFDDDGEYCCRLVRFSDGVHFVPEARVFYRRSGAGSLSNIEWKSKRLESEFLSMKLQVSHLLTLQDDEEAREACISYLQRYLIDFYPERLDVVNELRRLAESLGGWLEVPRLPRKYAWIQKVFGWPATKRIQLYYNHFKSSVLSSWDGALLRLKV